ncbi:MAG: hypothetical protein ACRD08_14570, partial [Acidimicrobiales bacterium]
MEMLIRDSTPDALAAPAETVAAKPAAVAGRRAGSSAMARSTADSSAGGTSGANSLIDGAGETKRRETTASVVVPSNGGRPA